MSMQDTTNYNRNHKDELFRFIFSSKEAVLSLYNAVNNSDYKEPEAIEFYTMNDFLYMGMKNDLSFLIDWNLNIFEHQSTYNPNMPLRGFIYTGSALKKYIEKNHLDIYGSKQLSIPVPRYYVFYNGLKEIGDDIILRLTDSMPEPHASVISSAEFTAHMININAAHSTAIMQRCPLLHQYSLFVALLRNHIAVGSSLGEAIEATVTESIKKGILSDLLLGHRAEVTDMLFKEFDSAAHIASEKEISYEEGFQDGLHRADLALSKEKENSDKLLRALILAYYTQGKSPEEIAELCERSIDFILDIITNQPQ